MASLPVDATPRLFVRYRTHATAGAEHELMVRYAGSDRAAVAAQTAVLSFLQAVTPGYLMNGWKVLDVRTALAGEGWTTAQATLPALGAFVGTNTSAVLPEHQANQWVWVGRGIGSPRRVRLSLFGLVATVRGSAFRLVPTTPTFGPMATNTVAVLNAAVGTFIAVDGSQGLWYNYVNVGVNDWWVRQVRKA